MRRTGQLLLLAAAVVFMACGDGSTAPDAGAPANLAVVSGNEQEDTVTRALDDTLVAKLEDNQGQGIQDAVISWVVTEGGGEVFSPSTGTDEQGFTRNLWTLGPVAGGQAVEARWIDPSTGETEIVGEFTATALPDSIVRIAVEADSATEANGDTVVVDDTAQYSATAFDEHDNVNSESGFEWTLSDPSVADIDQSGELVATATGSSAVLASKEGVTGRDSVFVTSDVSEFSLAFSGSQHTQTPDTDSLDLTSTFTIEAWIRPTNLPGSNSFQHLVSKWGSASEASYVLELHDQRLRLNLHDSDADPGNTPVLSNSTLTEDTWQHVAATFDNGEVRLYIGGSLDKTSTGNNEPQVTTTSLFLGQSSADLRHYEGNLDEVRVWSVVRTEEEINAAKDSRLDGTETGLVGYWPMNEGSGDVAGDSTGLGHDMRLGDTDGDDSADPAWESGALAAAAIFPLDYRLARAEENASVSPSDQR